MGIEKEGKPLVSICCTTYNIEKVVGEALDGFIMQKTDFPFEIVIHDDASVDGTRKVVQKYAERFPGRIKTIFQKENQFTREDTRMGKIFADFLFPEASGKYIAMCDGDDYWTDSNKLQLQVKYMRENSGCSGCFTNSLIINEIDKEEKKYHTHLQPGKVPKKSIILKGGGGYPTSTLLFDKQRLFLSSVYKNGGNYNAKIAGDTLLIYALIETGSVGYIDQVCAVYRRWESGDFSSIKDNHAELAKRLQQQLEGFKILAKYLQPEFKEMLDRKISVTAFQIIRFRKGFKRFKYLPELGYRELGKLMTGRK